MTINDAVHKCIAADGGLYNLGWYLGWSVGEREAVLDGRFTADDLRSIAEHMDKMNAQATTNR